MDNEQQILIVILQEFVEILSHKQVEMSLPMYNTAKPWCQTYTSNHLVYVKPYSSKNDDMTHGYDEQHSMAEVSIDALHSHSNPIYEVSSFISEKSLINIVLIVPDIPWAVRFQKNTQKN